MVLECRKLLKQKEDMGQGDDRISKLPDSLLHHILSFLKIKCVVRTSILSKRWKNVWATIPNLDFLEWLSPTTKDIHLEAQIFMNFMDRMLLHRGTSHNIQNFALKFDELLDASRMNSWISTVINCKVEVLTLRGSLKEHFVTPLSLFTCGSLIKLSLEIESDFDFSLPKSISFPRLRFLDLYRVTFRDEYLTEQLFTNCPVLKVLRLRFCTWGNMKIVCISAPTLKYLSIFDFFKTDIDGLRNCEVKIHAPKLRTLTYLGSVANAYSLSSFPSLNKAYICLVIGKNHLELGMEEARHGSNAINLLGELSNVKHLIFNRTLEALSFADSLFSNLRTFYNLIQFSVRHEVKYLFEIKALFLFLQKAPNLELLSFYKGFPPQAHGENDDDDWTPNMVADSLFPHLKEVYFLEFSGTAREMNLVKLILKNARALKTMGITYSSSLSENLNSQVLVMEKLQGLPRKSEGCVIELS